MGAALLHVRGCCRLLLLLGQLLGWEPHVDRWPPNSLKLGQLLGWEPHVDRWPPNSLKLGQLLGWEHHVGR